MPLLQSRNISDIRLGERTEQMVNPSRRGVTMTADPRALAELLEESQDLQADAMRPTHAALDELVELSHSSSDYDRASNVAFHEEQRRGLYSSLGGATLLGAAGGAALVGILASAAGA